MRFSSGMVFEMGYDIENLKKQETSCIESISDFIKADVDGRTKYSQSKRLIDSQEEKEAHDEVIKAYKAFWKNCLGAFNKYISQINDSRFDFSTIEVDESPAKSEQKSGSYKIEWELSSLDVLRKAYSSVRKEFLCDLKNGEIEEFDKIFNDFLKKIESVKHEPRRIKYKEFRLELLPKCINLSDKNVCELLPYLLTAYTFNSQITHFFYQQKENQQDSGDKDKLKRFPLLFSEGTMSTAEAFKIRELISRFANNFTLSACVEKGIIGWEDETPDAEGGNTYYNRDETELLYEYRLQDYMKGFSYFKYRSLLNDAFMNWCRIVRDCAQNMTGMNLAGAINYQKSLDLYNHHTRQSLHEIYDPAHITIINPDLDQHL